MSSDTSVLKWTAIVAVVIIGCFCLGYFLGPNFPVGGGDKTPTPLPGSTQVAMVPSSDETQRIPRPQVTLVDETATVEAENRRKEAEKKRKEEEQKKKEEAERKRLEEEALKAAATPTPSPTPDAPEGNETRDPEATTEEPKTAEPGAEEPPRTEVDTPKPEPERPKVAETPKPERPAETPKSTPSPAAQGSLYKVRVGSFPSEDNAKRKASELSGRGYQTRIVSETVGGKKVYRVQVGAYKDKANADRTALELRANGEDPEVSD